MLLCRAEGIKIIGWFFFLALGRIRCCIAHSLRFSNEHCIIRYQYFILSNAVYAVSAVVFVFFINYEMTLLVLLFCFLAHWGWVTHTCVCELNINGSNNGLSSSRLQAIMYTNDRKLLIRHLRKNFIEMLIKPDTLSLQMCLSVLSAKCRTFCLGRNALHAKMVIGATTMSPVSYIFPPCGSP